MEVLAILAATAVQDVESHVKSRREGGHGVEYRARSCPSGPSSCQRASVRGEDLWSAPSSLVGQKRGVLRTEHDKGRQGHVFQAIDALLPGPFVWNRPHQPFKRLYQAIQTQGDFPITRSVTPCSRTMAQYCNTARRPFCSASVVIATLRIATLVPLERQGAYPVYAYQLAVAPQIAG